MRRLLVGLALLMLAGCETGGGGPWYQSAGDADYDAVKRASEACKAKGGDFQLKKGGDPQQLSDFTCVGAKGP